MLILAGTSDRIQVALNAAHTTTPLRCYASFRDITTSAFTPGRTVADTNGTTDVDLVAPPSASTQRVCDFISVYNSDSAAKTVTVKYDDGSAEKVLWSASLNPGERVEYQEGQGFRAFTVTGAEKIAQLASGPAVNAKNLVILAANVVNNNAVANTIQDVTGLSFPVVAGETYVFRAMIPYSAAVTTTGSRWSVNGPANPTGLNYRSKYTLTATTETSNFATAYNIPAASNATSLTLGNVAIIEGVITPSSNGTVIIRFASEIAASAITALAGATLEWVRVI